MKVNSASITVHADEFVSSTTIEIEFYNPNDKEIEGWYSFTLRPGQVVTGFQLDINGHYREGSIEERWKARNAYNTIVGKRVDPGLLSMDNLHNYNLHIYPVPARGSRKVIITIQQLLQEEPARLTYLLPLHLPDTVSHFHLEITAETGDALPFAGTGMIETKSFTRNGNNYNLKLDAESVPIRKPIQFYIPFLSAGKICTMKKGEQQLFATRMIPRVSAQYEIHPERITAFWDVSR